MHGARSRPGRQETNEERPHDSLLLICRRFAELSRGNGGDEASPGKRVGIRLHRFPLTTPAAATTDEVCRILT